MDLLETCKQKKLLKAPPKPALSDVEKLTTLRADHERISHEIEALLANNETLREVDTIAPNA